MMTKDSSIGISEIANIQAGETEISVTVTLSYEIR